MFVASFLGRVRAVVSSVVAGLLTEPPVATEGLPSAVTAAPCGDLRSATERVQETTAVKVLWGCVFWRLDWPWMRGWYFFVLLALRIAGDELTCECVGGLYESNCIRTESGKLSRNPSSSSSAESPADVAIEAWCVRPRSTRSLDIRGTTTGKEITRS